MCIPRPLTFLGMSLPLLAALAFIVAGCSPNGEPRPQPSGSTWQDTVVNIEVAVYPDGSTLGRTYSLNCTGTEVMGQSDAPDPSAACAKIAQEPQLLTPQRSGHRACTEIYGGPDRAVVTGIVNGKRFTTEFTRSNGCFIAEWDALQPLLGGSSL